MVGDIQGLRGYHSLFKNKRVIDLIIQCVGFVSIDAETNRASKAYAGHQAATRA
ncbi:MAG: hypothetical protein ACYCSS_06495 [Sulfuriferula sp.]